MSLPPDFVFNTTDAIHDDLQTDYYVPRFVREMLKNVHISYDAKTSTLERDGDFWYWKLTCYGLDMMRALVHSSDAGFSYVETFLEPCIERLPQLTLLAQINSLLHVTQLNIDVPMQWQHLFEQSHFLSNKQVDIDVELFEDELSILVKRIEHKIYDPCGNRHYVLTLPQDLP